MLQQYLFRTSIPLKSIWKSVVCPSKPRGWKVVIIMKEFSSNKISNSFNPRDFSIQITHCSCGNSECLLPVGSSQHDSLMVMGGKVKVIIRVKNQGQCVREVDTFICVLDHYNSKKYNEGSTKIFCWSIYLMCVCSVRHHDHSSQACER